MTRATKVILFIAAVRFLSLWAGEPKSAGAARQGIALAYNMHLDEAERIFDSLIAQNPDDPQGYVLKSVVYYYRYLLDQSTAEIEKQFIKLAKMGIDRAQKTLTKVGNVFSEKNEYEKAATRFRDALECKAMAANIAATIDAEASLKIAECYKRFNARKKDVDIAG